MLLTTIQTIYIRRTRQWQLCETIPIGLRGPVYGRIQASNTGIPSPILGGKILFLGVLNHRMETGDWRAITRAARVRILARRMIFFFIFGGMKDKRSCEGPAQRPVLRVMRIKRCMCAAHRREARPKHLMQCTQIYIRAFLYTGCDRY
jgi:hypothetical protein